MRVALSVDRHAALSVYLASYAALAPSAGSTNGIVIVTVHDSPFMPSAVTRHAPAHSSRSAGLANPWDRSDRRHPSASRCTIESASKGSVPGTSTKSTPSEPSGDAGGHARAT